MKKKIIIITSIITFILSTIHIGSCDIIPSYDNRTIGHTYITIDKGIVLDEYGNGIVLTTNDPIYNYISYKGTENALEGNVIYTVCIYNPLTSYSDDIIARYDF